MPAGEGPFPVVVYAPGWTTPATMWAGDAVALSRQGYAGLLLGEPGVPFFSFDAPTDITSYVRYATQERRALDWLATLPKIDTKRIGFVGWSNGAILGSLVAGLDERIKACAFNGVCRQTSLSPSERKWFAQSGRHLRKGAAWARCVAREAVIDPVNCLGHNRGAAFLCLNGRRDWDATHDAKAFLTAAPKPKTGHVYAGGHGPPQAAREYLRA